MDFNNINKKAIIIAPYSYHKKLLNQKNNNHELKNIKIMTIEEFLKHLFFTYDAKAIVYLIEKYHIKYPLAILYLNHICTLENNLPIPWLKEMMNDLLNQNLLIKDLFFKDTLLDSEIYIYGYSHFSNYYKNILKPYKVTYIPLEKKDYTFPIYQYNTLDEEIENVANKIILLHNEGVPFSKIKIINGNNFFNTINRIFTNYHIPTLEKNVSIYSSLLVQDFLKELKDPIEETLEIIKNKYSLNKEENNQIYNQIIELLNKYYFVDSYVQIKECLIEELKNINAQKNHLKEYVELVEIEDTTIEDNYYFIIGMTQNTFPLLKKDDDFLSDQEKEKIGLETAKEYNQKEIEFIINKIKSIPNNWLSFHKNDGKEECLPSIICQKLNFPITENNLFSNIRFSKVADKISLAIAYDDWLKFGKTSNNMSYLASHIDIPYQKYNNQFTNIDKKTIQESMKKLTLSYTALNTYYKCPFRYYCSYILKLDKYETTFDAFVGSVFHNVLSKAFVKDNTLDTTTLYSQAIKEELTKLDNQNCQFTLTEENKTFIEFLKEDINFVVDTIKEQLKNSQLKNALFEKEIIVEKDNEIPVFFKGFIDKILILEENDKNYIAIIDYKTGKEEIEIKNVKFGLNLQLPVYLYLASQIEKWQNNTYVTGFYLQKILNKEQNQKPGISYNQLKKESLKLEGYSNTNIAILEKLEPNYEASQLIKGMRVKNDGSFYSTVKSLSEKNMQDLIKYVDKKIDEASNNILNGNFKIEPKRIGNDVISCNFCPFKELCYLEEKNIQNLTLPDNLDFLGDDENELY